MVEHDPGPTQTLGRPAGAETSTKLLMFLRNLFSLRVSCPRESKRDR